MTTVPSEGEAGALQAWERRGVVRVGSRSGRVSTWMKTRVKASLNWARG